MKVRFSEEFRTQYKKIKDSSLRRRIFKQIWKLEHRPEIRKPLKNKLKNHRAIRVEPFRIIYHIEENRIIVNFMDNQDNVYHT